MRRIVFIAFFLTSFSPFVWAQEKPSNTGKDYQPAVLVELFSSEGCSSCPYADQFLKELIDISDSSKSPVYVIDYHVVIWNRSGWVDPFSDSAYSIRQQEYLYKKKLTAMYTPMVFVNGGDKDLAGGDKRGIGTAIQSNLMKPSKHYLRSGVTGIENEDSLMVAFQIWGNIDSMDLKVALVQREINSQVKGGENAGLILHHHNVVRGLYNYPLTANEGMFKITMSRELNLDNFRLVLFVQQRNNFKVVAADQLTFKP